MHSNQLKMNLMVFKKLTFQQLKKIKIKAWKRHLKMTMNLIVPVGNVQFNFYDNQKYLK